jgi:hypothetical protein
MQPPACAAAKQAGLLRSPKAMKLSKQAALLYRLWQSEASKEGGYASLLASLASCFFSFAFFCYARLRSKAIKRRRLRLAKLKKQEASKKKSKCFRRGLRPIYIYKKSYIAYSYVKY